MKKTLLYAVLLSCSVLGCKQTKRVSYAGVFKLVKQTVNSGVWDTTFIRRQLKIYTDHNYIYAGIAPDSTVKFGLGSYEIDNGNRVDEHNIFNDKVLDSAQIFSVIIKTNSQGFTGITPDWAHNRQSSYTLTEDYTKLSLANTSALDGVWALDKLYWVNGKDTTKQHEEQFKVFYKGYFMFIHHYLADPLGTKFKNGFGYGKFTLNQQNLSEKVELSSNPALTGNQYVIKITFSRGNDEYTQVYTDPKTHVQTTEIYSRIQ